jgi:hypothetical protein
MCSELQYQSCRDNSPSLNKMCKLADSNSYWQGLNSAERATGFAHFRSETLRKAQSAFLFRSVAQGCGFASARLPFRLSSPLRRTIPPHLLPQRWDSSNRLRAIAQGALAEHLRRRREERELSVRAAANDSCACFLRNVQEIVRSDDSHHVVANLRAFYARGVFDLANQRQIHRPLSANRPHHGNS